MDTLALTDRDGTYGAVRFAKACLQDGVRPVLGVDLAIAPAGRSRPAGRPVPEPARPRQAARPRSGAARSATSGCPGSTFLAGEPAGLGGAVPAGLRDPPGGGAGRPGVHPRPGRRARRRHATCWCCSGPAPSWARAATLRRDDLARAALRPWLRAGRPGRPPRRGGLPPAARVRSRLVDARRPDGRRWPGRRARRGAHQRGPLRRPRRRADRRRPRRRPPAGAARPAPRRPRQRRGVPQVRQGDGRGRRGGLPLAGLGTSAGGPAAAGPHPGGGRPVRARPARRPRAGRGALPRARGDRPERGRAAPHRRRVLRARCEAGIGRRYGSAPRQRIWKRLDDELQIIGSLGYASYFLTVADVCDLVRDMGVRSAARGSGAGQPGQLPARRLRGRPAAPRPADGAVPLPAAAGAARHRHRRGVRAPARDLRGGPRPLRRGALRLRLDDGHLPGPARGPRRRRGAGHAARARSTRSPRRSRTSGPATPGWRCASCPSCVPPGWARSGSTCCSGSPSGSTACPGTSPCTRAACCSPTRPCSTGPRWRRASPGSR